MNKVEALHYYAQEVKDIKEAGLFKGCLLYTSPDKNRPEVNRRWIKQIACKTGRFAYLAGGQLCSVNTE